MAKRVIVQGVCDKCGSEYEAEVEGATYTIGDGSKAHFEIDLCPNCTHEFTRNYIDPARIVKPERKPRSKAKPVQDTGYLPAVAAGTYSGRPRTIKCEWKKTVNGKVVETCDYAGPDARALASHTTRAHKPKGKK